MGNNTEDDPDYSDFHKKQTISRTTLTQEDTKEKTIQKIEAIIHKQFDVELKSKERELAMAERRINQTKTMLDRLRAYVLANYFSTGEVLINCSRERRKRKPKSTKMNESDNEPNVLKVVKKEKDDFLQNNRHLSPLSKETPADLTKNDRVPPTDPLLVSTENSQTETSSIVANRFYVTKKVIVGNISKYITPDNRQGYDKSTHKWMVYVRGPKDNPDITDVVKSVSFFLHPSYIPNDIVHILQPPFQLTRRGWGEFPIRVQLHFVDTRNKKFDIIHHLKLDKTYTGLQTLGAETLINLELNRHAHMTTSASRTAPQTDRFFKIEKYESSNILKTNGICKASPSIFSEKTSDMSEKLLLENGGTIKSEFDFDSTASLLRDVLGTNGSHLPLSTVSSAVSSPCVSRPTSPVSKRLKKDKLSISFANTDKILFHLVRFAKLINPKRDIRLHPFAALSKEQYSSWCFSKRRAAEWQRASFLKCLFIDHLEEEKLIIPVPSTKHIYLWCRKFGFTPVESSLRVLNGVKNLAFCEECGRLLNNMDLGERWCKMCMDAEFVQVSSRSPAEHVRMDLYRKQTTLKANEAVISKKDGDLDCQIDVVSLPVTVEEPDEGPLYEAMLPSDELLWVYDTASDVNVDLLSINLHGVRAPLLQALVYAAMKRFAADLVRRGSAAASNSKKHSLEPVLVKPTHIFSAIKHTDYFDFLTEANLYYEKKES